MLMTPTSPICNPIVVEKLPSCLVGLQSLTRTSWNMFWWELWQLYQLSTHLDDNYDNFPLSNQTDRMSHSLIVWSLLLLIRCLPSPFGSRNAIPSTWPENWKLQSTILSTWLVCKKRRKPDMWLSWICQKHGMLTNISHERVILYHISVPARTPTGLGLSSLRARRSHTWSMIDRLKINLEYPNVKFQKSKEWEAKNVLSPCTSRRRHHLPLWMLCRPRSRPAKLAMFVRS